MNKKYLKKSVASWEILKKIYIVKNTLKFKMKKNGKFVRGKTKVIMNILKT